MTMLWIKSLHIGADLLFTSGLLLLAVAASSWTSDERPVLPHEQRVVQALLQWDRRVTAPALATVWATGLVLAVWGGWFGQVWLTGKIALVIALSALHGLLSATLRRRMNSATEPQWPSWIRFSPIAVAASLAWIAVLVTVKP